MKLGAYFAATNSDQPERLQKLEERVNQFTAQLQACAAAMFSESDEIEDEVAPKQEIKPSKKAEKAEETKSQETKAVKEEAKQVKPEKKQKPDPEP